MYFDEIHRPSILAVYWSHEMATSNIRTATNQPNIVEDLTMAKSIETFIDAVNGGYEEVILTDKSDWYDYKNGQRGDTCLGTKYQVVLPGNRLTPLTVKIPGPDPLPQVTDEQLAVACLSRQYAYAVFAECRVMLYAIDGMVMTATATGVELVKPGNAKQ